MMPEQDHGSFRDRKGFVFVWNNEIYRAVHKSFESEWINLSKSELFQNLLSKKRIPSFDTVEPVIGLPAEISKCVKVQKIPFISWPCEWTFDQLKSAALLTLNVYRAALKHGYTLRDASAYNIQFEGFKPVFIDLFSFGERIDGKPWEAYGQFCRHFLAPLALMHYKVPGVNDLLSRHIDGIPLAIASELLPTKSRLSLAISTHIHLHAKYENKYSGQTKIEKKEIKISLDKLKAVADHLYDTIRDFKSHHVDTNWSDYYQNNSYSSDGEVFKRGFCEAVAKNNPGSLCVDLGANAGEYSRIVAPYFQQVVACDMDETVITDVYRRKTENILPLLIRLENPTPAFGWANNERASFIQRIAKADLTMALALVHHLCIGNNVPVAKLADFFGSMSKKLIIEFVPKSDVQVSRLLVTREDVFDDYTLDNFTKEFSRLFNIQKKEVVPGSDRVLFYMILK